MGNAKKHWNNKVCKTAYDLMKADALLGTAVGRGHGKLNGKAGLKKMLAKQAVKQAFKRAVKGTPIGWGIQITTIVLNKKCLKHNRKYKGMIKRDVYAKKCVGERCYRSWLFCGTHFPEWFKKTC